MNQRGLTLIELLMIMAIFAVVLAIVAPKILETPGDRAEKTAQKAKAWAEYVDQRNQDRANEAIKNLVYIKDPRTDICFAYCWGGGTIDGGPAITVVPCEMVPAELLHVAKIDDKIDK